MDLNTNFNQGHWSREVGQMVPIFAKVKIFINTKDVLITKFQYSTTCSYMQTNFNQDVWTKKRTNEMLRPLPTFVWLRAPHLRLAQGQSNFMHIYVYQ